VRGIDLRAQHGNNCVMQETLSLTDIAALATDCLTRAGVALHVARCVADEVAAGEAAADPSQGLITLLRDLKSLRYGHLRPDTTPAITLLRPGLVEVDAGHGFAGPALCEAVPHLVQAVEGQGLAAVHLRHATPAGAMHVMRSRLHAAGVSVLSAESEAGHALDDPFAGPVAASAWVLGADPKVLPVPSLPAPASAPAQDPIAVPTELVEQILAA